jgi:hypothetical protein
VADEAGRLCLEVFSTNGRPVLPCSPADRSKVSSLRRGCIDHCDDLGGLFMTAAASYADEAGWRCAYDPSLCRESSAASPQRSKQLEYITKNGGGCWK